MDNLIQLFSNSHGTFKKSLQFDSIIVFVVILCSFYYFFSKTYAFVVILVIFALYVTNIYVRTQSNKELDYNQITLFKLNSIQKTINEQVFKKLKLFNNTRNVPLSQNEIHKALKANQMSSLYSDATLVHFLHSVQNLASYNGQLYVTWVKGINGILQIKQQIERFYSSNNQYPENIAELFETALLLRQNTINNAHDFIYSVPKTTVMYNYIDTIVDRFSILITRNTDQINSYYLQHNKLTGINNNTKFVSYNTTKPNSSYAAFYV